MNSQYWSYKYLPLEAYNKEENFTLQNLLGHCSDCDVVVVISAGCSAHCEHERSPLNEHYGHALAYYQMCLDGVCTDPRADIDRGGFVYRPDGVLQCIEPRRTFDESMADGGFDHIFENGPEGKKYLISEFGAFVLGDFGEDIGDEQRLWCKYCEKFVTIEELREILPESMQHLSLKWPIFAKWHHEHAHGPVRCICGDEICFNCHRIDIDHVAIRELWKSMGLVVEDENRQYIFWMANVVLKHSPGLLQNAIDAKRILKLFEEQWQARPTKPANYGKLIAESLAIDLAVSLLPRNVKITGPV